MAHEPPNGRRVFLSTLPADPGERRLAFAVVLVSAAIFVAAVPFAKVPLAQIPAFIPIYQSALTVNDLITAVLLFGQFSFLRSRGLLVLASGYLFTALMAMAHMLTFPGLFAPSGLLGAGAQSTAWLYMFWHGGFPLLVIAYALRKPQEHDTNPSTVRTTGLAREALTWVDDADVVVTDYAMPGDSGLWLLARVRERPRPVPVIVLTGYDDVYVRELAEAPFAPATRRLHAHRGLGSWTGLGLIAAGMQPPR
jgi:CheY-like chemotaxis protein